MTKNFARKLHKAALQASLGMASRTAIERAAAREISTNLWRLRPVNDASIRDLLRPPSLGAHPNSPTKQKR